MSIGKKIKQLRELRNFTQSYMAEQLGISLPGYGRIERDETDISIGRLNQIADILQTDLATVLNFEASHIFNQYNNRIANANGTVQNQIIGDEAVLQYLERLLKDMEKIRHDLDEIKRRQDS